MVQSDNLALQEGQKVAVNPSELCGSCKYCLADDDNQCTTMRFFGSAMYTPHVDGGFTQYKVVDSAQCIAYDNAADVPGFQIMMLIAKEINLVGSFRFLTEFNTAVK